MLTRRWPDPRNRVPLVWLRVIVLMAAASAPAIAQVELRFDPPAPTLDEGEITTLSIMIDEPMAIRTFEATIAYATDAIESLSGEPGLLFADPGFLLWEVFEEDQPGQWHGAAVVIGATSWVNGPGELFRWSFRGLRPGVFLLEVLQVALYAPDGSVIPGVTLEQAVVVGPTPDRWGTVKALYR